MGERAGSRGKKSGLVRYGGEEFLIILGGASGEDAANRAEYIRNQIKEIKIMYHGAQLPAVTASLGVAVYDENNNTAADIQNAADKALYSAKDRGRDCVVMA
jgi:diguanylate cyclase (GGDEF)-like protein